MYLIAEDILETSFGLIFWTLIHFLVYLSQINNQTCYLKIIIILVIVMKNGIK